jgi:hypothetical protein
MIVEGNIFIDFSIIQKSNPSKLKDELDLLVSLKNKVYLWSKTIDLVTMRRYCLSIKYSNIEDKELHKKVIELRAKKKQYSEISKETSLPIWKIGFYLTTDPEKEWTLDDWIKDYVKKDSAIYSKVDFIIDPDKKIVDRFKSRGIDGNCIEKI